MVQSPRITIVGPGNLGTALANSLRRAGFAIDAIVGRARGNSIQGATRLAKEVGGRSTVTLEMSTGDLIWFCVPDSEIERTAQAFAEKMRWKVRVALHSSGALTSEALGPLREQGAAIASAHPFMTFVRNSQASFQGVPFAIEGDGPAVRMTRGIVRELGGVAYSIRKEDKAAYHAWGTFASPLLTTLLATTERVASLSGVKKNDALRRMMPILRQTLENYASFGGARGFSGPIIRGDVDTVKGHVRVLRGEPAAREVYVALARAALQYLPAKNKGALRRALAGKG